MKKVKFKKMIIFVLVFFLLFLSWPWLKLGEVYAAGCSTAALGTGSDVAASTIAPGSAIADRGVFTITGSGSSCSVKVTALTVTLAGSGTPYNGLAEVRITNSAGTTTYFSPVTTFSSNSVSFSGGVTIPIGIATAGAVTFKIQITPLSHANMPAVPGASYVINPLVSAWTTTLTKSGSDTNPNSTTIDNASPANVTSATGTAGIEQVVLNWTNPGDSDFSQVVVLRRAGSAVTDTPVEGIGYSVGNIIGSSTVACITSSATCTDTGLTGGTAYHYKIFAKDSNGNYSATGVVPSGSPFTPTATIVSVTLTSDGTVSYGTTTVNTSKDTTSSGLNDTQTAKNDGNVAEDLNIKGQNSTNWTLGATTGTDQYVHKFSLNGGGVWTALTTSYQSLVTNLAANGTKSFDLQITTPTSTSSYSQQVVDIIIQAVQH